MSADEREVADAMWTLDDDGILDAIETSVSPGVARAVRTLLTARLGANLARSFDELGPADCGQERRSLVLADEINARADESDPPVATVGVSTLRRWATTVRALAAPPAPAEGGPLRKSVGLTCRGCSAPIVTVPDDDGRVMCPGCRTMHPAPAAPQTYTCPCGTVSEPCPGPEDRPLCMRYSVSREDLT